MDSKLECRGQLRISHVQWRTFTPDEVTRQAVSEVKYATLNDKKLERREGPNCPMSGPGDRGDLCLTCREDIQGCMGHPLFTKTAIPVTNKIFRSDIIHHLRTVCFYCSTIRLRAEPTVLQRIVRNFDEKKRLQELSKASRPITICGESRQQRQKLKRDLKKLQKQQQQQEAVVAAVVPTAPSSSTDETSNDPDLNHKWSDDDEEEEEDGKEGDKSEKKEAEDDDDDDDDDDHEADGDDDEDEHPPPPPPDDDIDMEDPDDEKGPTAGGVAPAAGDDIEVSPDDVMDENGLPKKKKKKKHEEDAEEDDDEDVAKAAAAVPPPEEEEDEEDEEDEEEEEDQEEEREYKTKTVPPPPSPLTQPVESRKRKVSSFVPQRPHPPNQPPMSIDHRGCCGRLQPKYNIAEGRIKAEFAFPISDYGRKKFPRYNPRIVMDLLNAIQDEDVKILGSDPEKSHPGNNITDHLIVAPKSIRLSAMKTEGTKSRHHDDLTINYRRIRTTNDRLERELREKKWEPHTRNLPNIDVDYFWVKENGEKIPCKCNRSEQDDYCICLSHSINGASPSTPVPSITGGPVPTLIQPFLGRRPRRVKTIVDLYHELQYAVDCIEQGDSSGGGGDKGGGGGGGMGGGNRNEKPVRGIWVRLKGKGGRMRSNLCGRRQNFSARTVVDPDPTLDPNQIGVPRHMARILTYPEKVQSFNITRLTNLLRTGGIKMVDCGDGILKDVKYLNMATFTLQPGYIVERHLQDGDIILVNRQPTLHRNNLLAFFVKVVDGRALRLPTCVTDGYNADHDGDEMNLFPPMDDMSRAEALYLLLSQYHTVTSQSGKPLNSHKLNTLIAPYYLTAKTTLFDKSTFAALLYRFGELKNDEERQLLLRHQRLNRLPTPAVMVKKDGKWEERWTGKQLFSAMLPSHFMLIQGRGMCPGNTLLSNEDEEPLHISNGEIHSGRISGKNYGNVFNGVIHTMWNDYGPTVTHRYLAGTYRVLNEYLQAKGFSISVGDMTSSIPELTQVIAKRGVNWADRVARHHYSPEVRSLTEAIRTRLGHRENKEVPIYDVNESKTWSPPSVLPNFTSALELEDYLVQHLSKMRDIANQHVYESAIHKMHGTTHHNGFADAILSASKGSSMNYGQVLSFVGLQALSGRRISVTLPHSNICASPTVTQGMILHSFDEGQTLQEMHVQAECGRETLIDTGTKTSVTGYMQRKLVKAMENLMTTFNNSVTNAEGEVFMTTYGQDGTDPAHTQHLLCRLMDVNNRATLLQQYHIPSVVNQDSLLRCFDHISYVDQHVKDRWTRQMADPHVQQAFANHIQSLSDARAYLLWCAVVSCKRRVDSTMQSLIPYSRLWAMMEMRDCCNSMHLLGPAAWEWTPYEFLCGIEQAWKDVETRHLKRNAWYLKDPSRTMYEEQRNSHTRNFTWVEVMYRDWVHLFRIVREFPDCVSSPSKWQEMTRNFEQYQNRAYVCAGTNVGMNAASSIGEPATQMTMKTFHFAGNTSKLISGIPKLQQMWNGKKIQLGVQMKFYLQAGINLEHCQYFCARLPLACLDQYIQTDDVVTNQKRWDEADSKWLVPLKEGVGAAGWSVHPYSLRLVLNKAKCQARYVTPQEIAARVLYYFMCELDSCSTPLVHVWPTPRTADQWVLRIEFDPTYSYLSQLSSSDSSSWEAGTSWRRLLYQMRKNVVIHGVSGIEHASYKMVAIREWNREKEEMQEHSRFLVETQGSNLRKVRRLPEVDWTYCTSSNMHEIDDCLGTIVMGHWIANSSRETMEDNGSVVNFRHIELLGRTMTRHGDITSLTRHKLNLVQKNVLKRAAFEESIDMFRQGATFALKDTISGITECTIMGSTSLCGTGLTFIERDKTMSLDSECKAGLTPESAWERCQLVPYRGTASFYNESLPCLTDDLVSLETSNIPVFNKPSVVFAVWNMSEADTLQFF